jgi:CRISPR-associated protein Cas2
MHTVIAYDVADDARRQRVMRALEDMGDRVQRSVFEAVLTAEQLSALRERILPLIDPQEDSVRFYPLCQACKDRMDVLGVQRTVGDEEAFII